MTQTNQNDHLNTLHLSHEQLCDHLLTLTAAPSSETAALGSEIAALSSERTAQPETAGPYLVSAPANEAAVSRSASAVNNHLRACSYCASELNSLQSALFDFRAASTGFAAAELESLTTRTASQTSQRILSLAEKSNRPVTTRPLTWAIAAMLLVGATVGSVIPLRLHRPAQILDHPAAAGSQPAPTGESDEALLEEVDQTLSTDVPSAMKPLSDPLANQNSLASNQITDQTTGKKIDHE